MSRKEKNYCLFIHNKGYLYEHQKNSKKNKKVQFEMKPDINGYKQLHSSQASQILSTISDDHQFITGTPIFVDGDRIVVYPQVISGNLHHHPHFYVRYHKPYSRFFSSIFLFLLLVSYFVFLIMAVYYTRK